MNLSWFQVRNFAVVYGLFLLSLSVHEFARACMAYKLGDLTPKEEGRLTLNPVAHADLIGTVLFPLIFLLFPIGFMIFGWAKPLNINKKNFKNQKRGEILCSLAGPLSNLGMAIGIVLLFKLGLSESIRSFLFLFLWVNVFLLVFNLLPFPPLPGSLIIKHLFNISEEQYLAFSRWSLLLVLIFLNVPQTRQFLAQLIQWVMTLLFKL